MEKSDGKQMTVFDYPELLPEGMEKSDELDVMLETCDLRIRVIKASKNCKEMNCEGCHMFFTVEQMSILERALNEYRKKVLMS